MLKRGDPRHGTVNGYSNYSCHCKKCRAAWKEYIYKRKLERKGSPDTPHGTRSGYMNWVCRCDACTIAMGYTLVKREQIIRGKQVVKLAEQGHTALQIAEELGYDRVENVRGVLRYNGIRAKPETTGSNMPPTPEFDKLKWTKYDPAVRDILVREVRKQGFTLARIGNEIGITREGVRQIIAKEGKYNESSIG